MQLLTALLLLLRERSLNKDLVLHALVCLILLLLTA